MEYFRIILSILSALTFSSSLEDIWHSYQHDPDYYRREELVITNITSDDQFKLEHHVTKWKSLRVEKTCYAAGLTERNVVIASIELDVERKKFLQDSFTIEMEDNPVDIVLFEHWNSTSRKSEAFVVIATTNNELLWFKIHNLNYSLYWSWSLQKNISHINFFQIEYNYHVFIITSLLSKTTGDLYEFQLENSPNFWLRQTISLSEPSTSSAFVTTGPHSFLAVPQQSLQLLLMYKLENYRFLHFKNLTSDGINEVVSFEMGPKSFLAVNGFDAGIYGFYRGQLMKEGIVDSHFDGVNYWLPIPVTMHGEKTILMAQRSLDHGLHESFVTDIITYDGERFEKHEDIHCLYYGEEILASSCLPGEESKGGIMGATPIYIDDVLGLLIPRDGGFSEMFMIETQIKKNPNPVVKELDDFIKKREMLSNLMAEQERRYEDIVGKRREPLSSDFIRARLEEMHQNIISMKEKLHELSKRRHYDTIIFNGPVEVGGDVVVEEVEVKTIDGKPADEVFADIVLKNDMKPILSKKIFTNLEVDDLYFDTVNQVRAENLLYTTSKNITINGDLIIEKPLVISENLTAETVNGIILEKEVVDFNSPVEELVFEDINVLGDVAVDQLVNVPLPPTSEEEEIDSLFVPHNMEVENINGENFNDLLKEIYLRNIKNYIPGTVTVKGNVTVTGKAKVDYINDVKFPEEYVFANSNTTHYITGKKIFNNTLKTSELKLEGLINNVNTSELITLSTDQHIPGKTTFKNLKITESLKVEGEVLGEDVNKFLPNPTLLEEKLIKANVHFNNLTVKGKIILSENFNGKNFEKLLKDVVYSTEEEAVIEAVKQFPEGFRVSGDLTIDSNSINDIDLDSIVTKDTDQTLNFTTLHGTVDFGSIEISGLYDFVDVKKLDEETVKLDGEQYISSTLIFEDDLEVNELEITGSVDGLDEDQLSSIIPKLPEVIEAETVIVEGNVCGNIDGFDLADFDRRRLSLTKNQTIEVDSFFEELVVETLEPKEFNGEDFNEVTRKYFEEKMKEELRKGNVKVKDMYVRGPLEIDRINNQSTIGLGGSLWKNHIKKHNITTLIFEEDTYFNTVEIEKLSNVTFSEWVDNFVFKNETNPIIKGNKTFLEGFTVDKLIETKKLNNVLLSNILTKQGVQEIQGPIIIHGDVTFEGNITVIDNLNGIPIDSITDVFQETDDGYIVKGDVLFSRLAHIYALQLDGDVDGKSAEELIKGIVYKDGDFKLSGNTTFENKVLVEKNMRILDKINGIDLSAFVSNMVMTTKDTVIKSPVRFKGPVIVKEHITANDVETGPVNGVDLNYLRDNAVYVNRGYLEGTYLFDEVEIVDTLRTEFINDIDMNTLIPLRTDQVLPEMNFSEITTFNDINVGNLINNYYLPAEYANTVLINEDQDIDSDIEFVGRVFVEGNVEVEGLLNGMDVDKIVTTNTDQELSAIYNFNSKVTLEKDLIVHGLVNGINMTQWSVEGLKLKTSVPENITEDWFIEGDLIFEDEVTGNALINGVDLQQFKQEVEDQRNYKYAVEKGFIDDYVNMCKDLTYMYDKLKKQIYIFNYLENLQELDFKNRLGHVYHFNHRNNVYLLVNEEKSCTSHLFVLDDYFRFVRSVDLGMTSQIISVHDGDLIYFVVKNDIYGFCEVEGTNIWQLLDDDFQFQHLLNMEDQELLQESLVPGTFYGIRGRTVMEFKVLPHLEPRLRKYRKWEVNEDNMAFVPRGLSTGLALRTGRKLIRLQREDPILDEFDYDTEAIIIGNYTEEFNIHLPGRKSSDLVAMKVGVGGSKRTLLAVASHEETSVKGNLDFIKIYEDVIEGRVFHKVATYKPSSLVTMNFNNGETFLVFMEDQRVLQLYEYKGIEGFKHKLSVKVEGSKLLALSANMNGKQRTVLGVVDRNRIIFMEAVMLGNKIDQNLQCHL